MTVFVKCQICGSEQKSMIQTGSEQGLKNGTFSNNYQKCTNCNAKILIDNKTLYWK